MENFDGLSFRELIRLRDALSGEINRKVEAKSDEVKIGQLYTQYQGDGSKYEHLVIDVYSEYISEYEEGKRVKSILYYVRPDGTVESRGVFNDEADVFAETVVLRDYSAPNSVRQTSISEGEYAEALNKLETEFYKKATK